MSVINVNNPNSVNTQPREQEGHPPDDLSIRIKKLPDNPVQPKPLKNKVHIFNDLGATARVFKVKDASQKQQIEQAYQQLRSSVVGTSRAAEAVLFNLSKMTAWIKYENGEETTLDLQALVKSDSQIKQQYKSLEALVRPIWGGPTRSEYVESEKKSSSRCNPPLQRGEHPVLKQLPKTDLAASKALAMELYTKCINANTNILADAKERLIKSAERNVDYIAGRIPDENSPELAKINKNLKDVEEELKKLQLDLDKQDKARADSPEKFKDATRRKEELIKQQRRFDFDKFVLCCAAAFTPKIDPNWSEEKKLQAVTNAANAMRATLQAHIDQLRNKGVKENWPTFLPGFIRGTAAAENMEFSVDAAALIFSLLPVPLRRIGYLNFMAQHSCPPKRESSEDTVFHMAFRIEINEPNKGSGNTTTVRLQKIPSLIVPPIVVSPTVAPVDAVGPVEKKRVVEVNSDGEELPDDGKEIVTKT